MKKASAILLLLLVTAAVYLPSLPIPFYYDDYPHFVENPRVLHPTSLADVFRNGKQETRPVFNASLAAQAFFFGTDAVAAHAVNVMLFFGSGILFCLLVMRITAHPALSVLSALLFLVHPMAVESVVYVNSRSGLLALFFSLAAYVALAGCARRSFWLGIFFLFLAMASKEDAVAAVPIAVLLHIKFGKSPWTTWRKVAIAAPLLSLPLLYGLLRSPHVGTIGSAVASWYGYLWRQGVYLPLHLSRFVWPWPLTLNWDLASGWYSLPAVLGGWCALAALGWSLWRKRASLEAFALAWMFLALLPTHSVVPLLDVQATRVSFPALPGFAILLAALLERLFRRSSRSAFVLGTLLILFFSWRTVQEIWVWRNPVRMWQTNVAAAPSRWRGWINLAVERGERNEWAEAWNALAIAARLNPEGPEVLYNQAVVAALRTDGPADARLARKLLVRVLWLKPDHERARDLLRQLRGRLGRPGVRRRHSSTTSRRMSTHKSEEPVGLKISRRK